MSDAVLRAEALGKIYKGWLSGRVEALSGLDLEVRRGEIFGFLGQNGAGKTTAMHLMMGFLRATTGRAWVLGEPAGTPEVYRRVGFVPEILTFYPFLRGRKLLELFCRLLGMQRAQMHRRVDAVAAMIPLEDALDRKVGACSRGMLQRLGIAQALLGDPEVLLLDEPSSGLDPIGRRQVRQLLQSLRQAGRSVLLSSHILSDIEQVCDRVAIIKRGRLVRCGTVAELSGPPGGVVVRAAGLATERLRQLLAGAREVAESSDGTVRATFPTEADGQAAVAALVAAGGRLVEMAPARGHLEEVFVETVAGTEAS